MTLAAALAKPLGQNGPAGDVRAELVTLTMWTALGAGILPATELSPPRSRKGADRP
jgi:hypothetical protein